MNKLKAIRTDADHAAALARIDELMDAELGTPEGDELDVLTDLVELYESKTLDFGNPDPVAAIRFRMEQDELTPRDLIPLVGSRSKVSEVLSGKREITMKMARALHEHLGIPAQVLLGGAREPAGEAGEPIQWDRFPLKALNDAGWIPRPRRGEDPETLLRPLAKAGGGAAACRTLFRKTATSRANAKSDAYALIAWCWRVRAEADELPLKGKYRKNSIAPEFLRELSKMSRKENGPAQAREFLSKHGIAMVVVQHLPRTYLDGAAMKGKDGRRIVAVTLRYDRIDHFWFCLFHELAHVAKHLDADDEPFLDDLSLVASDDKEKEADRFARDGLITEEQWEAFSGHRDYSPMAVFRFADKLEIHPAIVAGRIRHEEKNYRLLSQFVGSGEIRSQFRGFSARKGA